MSFNLLVPGLDSNPKNTKDAVISILTERWPMTLREIFHSIKKKYAYSSSYQAVFKAVNELYDRKVLVRKAKSYSINISWVKELQSFTDIVETNYYAKNKMNNLTGLQDAKGNDDMVVMNFESVFDAEKYLYYFMKTELLKKKNLKVCYQLMNEWRPIFYLRSEHNYYKKLMKRGHDFYFVCSGGNEIEKMCQKFYRSIGAKYKFVPVKFATDVIVFGDFFIQILIPADVRRKMRACLDKKDVMKLLTDVMEKKGDVRVIITKDKGIVKDILTDVVGAF